MNNEIYRKNKITFVWRCDGEDRKLLKMIAAKKGLTMSDLLTKAWRYYAQKNKLSDKVIP